MKIGHPEELVDLKSFKTVKKAVSGFLSPRQIAAAAAISESTVKRWCDQGLIPCFRTAGGHRRIPAQEALRVLRERRVPLVHPEALSLPAISGKSRRVVDLAVKELIEALENLREDRCRTILLELYHAGFSIAEIGDAVIAPAFDRIGQDCACGRLQIYRERGACEIVESVLNEFDRLIPAAAADRPLAVGGTLSNDHYTLASQLVRLVFREKGWRALYLGPHLPTESLSDAIRELRPRIFWLSACHVQPQEALVEATERLYRVAEDVGSFLLLGGRGVEESLRRVLRYSAFCQDLVHLTMLIDMLPLAGR